MGKTGSVEWYQIRGQKGQVRLVPSRSANVKGPGPMQRYDSDGRRRRKMRRSKKNVIGPKGKTETR